eukprot:CAMPEP_0118932566 /NCGR_PEP_ID=MMETSP1169-20130426/10499_1 /TAXON_ID=36882 /ORGANISM="Pyramimonas obovata, Strain CCMP722" /LENGTH=344 /DNA_ID=CAMNT_0006875243 /DNA_START=282 /DNA_END=1316 /DNA_ORIENTATION=+
MDGLVRETDRYETSLQTRWSLSRGAALSILHTLPGEHHEITQVVRNGTGVLCLAGHIDPNAKTSSVYLQQCAHALTRWKDVFQLRGGMYEDFKLALVTDRQRFQYQIHKDSAFKKFVTDDLTHSLFIDDWTSVPRVGAGLSRRFRLPQSSKFQGFPQLWVYKFEAIARAPFQTTLFVDYDVHACPGGEKIFELYSGVDVAPMDCEFSCWGGTRQQKDYGAYYSRLTPELKRVYVSINEPLTAGILVRTDNVHARQLLLLARDIYIRSMRMSNNPIKHDQPALREALFLAGHYVNSTRIHQNHGCDFKLHNQCESTCGYVHGKITLEPLVAGRKKITSWASRVGQ